MDSSELKKIMQGTLEDDSFVREAFDRIEQEGINDDFSRGFTGRVLDKLFSAKAAVASEIEFSRYLNFAFSRVALTGVAAIVLLLVSIFLMEGSLSLNSFLGINDNYDESIICLLTGN